MQLVAKHARRVIVMSVGQVALDTTPAQAFAQIDLLESLALRPPQVTRLAHLLGRRGEAILGVAELCDWLAANYPPQQSAENAPS
jgi:hypothetical protein